MSREFFSPRIQNYLTWQVRQHSQKTGTSPVQPGPFITISREYGCQGRPLASLLAERLNEISPDPTPWVAMEKEVIEKIAQKEGEVATFVNALSDSRRSYIRQTADILIGQKPTEYQAYETLAESLTSLAHAGRTSSSWGEAGRSYAEKLKGDFTFGWSPLSAGGPTKSPAKGKSVSLRRNPSHLVKRNGGNLSCAILRG